MRRAFSDFLQAIVARAGAFGHLIQKQPRGWAKTQSLLPEQPLWAVSGRTGVASDQALLDLEERVRPKFEPRALTAQVDCND